MAPPWTPRSGSGRSRPDGTSNGQTPNANTLDPSSALARRPEIANSNILADSSDSDFDYLQPEPSKGRSQHGRSVSNPFPSLFSGKKKRHEAFGRPPPNLANPVSSDEDERMAKQVARRHKKEEPKTNKEFSTGNCMTCASLVKWPRELKVFRCTICMTINDLVPRREGQQDRGSDMRRGDASLGVSSSKSRTGAANVQTISLEYSRRMVRQCLRSYIYQRLCTKASPEAKDEPVSQERRLYTNRLQPEAPIRRRELSDGYPSQDGQNENRPIYEPQFVFDEAPTLRPRPFANNSSMSRSYSSSYTERPHIHETLREDTPRAHHTNHFSGGQEPRKIFRRLEDYIIECFNSFDCVNSSFAVADFQRASSSKDPSVRRKPLPIRKAPEARQSKGSPPGLGQAKDSVYELDPKVLLLGDVAENGTWWAGGGRDAPPTTPSPNAAAKSTTTTSSPHISWDNLSNWYASILNAAEGWFGIYEELSQDPNFEQPDERDLQALERDLLESQAHMQRVLMKSIEVLLKRPGRQIAEPTQLRFLLIIMENPLLHTGSHQFQGLLQPPVASSSAQYKSSTGHHFMPKSGLLSGQHSGVIKRIIGIVSNSSAECHNQLIVWLARYQNSHFLRTKELVCGFLTYRMLRQNEKKQETKVDVTAGLIPQMQPGRSGAYLHDEILASGSSKKTKEAPKKIVFAEDWQIKAASRVLALLFAANNLLGMHRGDEELNVSKDGDGQVAAAVRDGVHASGQILPTSDFYITMVDYADLVADFESWESKSSKFSFCQYPFLLSIWAKAQILEYDTRRQMQNKARDAFFDSIMSRRAVNQFLYFDIRRDCLVDDSLKAVSEVIGSGSEDVKKGLRISFRGEEGIDGGGIRKEWFLLLVREVFNPDHGLFSYDEDSQYCYFNPNTFEPSDQFFLVGVVMGLAIYNSTILDVALPPFAFRKLLASAPAHGAGGSGHARPKMKYTLEDLAEYRPRLARGLRQLLDYDGDVETTFCLDFVIETDRYGASAPVALCHGGERIPVTNRNRREYVDLYVRYMLDTSVKRQFEPFKRGFYTVCGGNAFSLFRPEEIELLVRGSDESVDVESMRAIAEYDNWGSRQPDGSDGVVSWFWESFRDATPIEQRRLLLFITGSDRLPAMGAAMLPIKISCLGDDSGRYPIARTCFNMLSLWRYGSKDRLEAMLWRAVHESEGFGLK